MFGYILPDKPEMKIKEFELFRAYYCGICKSMGRNSGFGARMSLNYDAVFLGLFLSSLLEDENEIKKEVCIANPIKKKPVVRNSKALDYAADINTLLAYYKLVDDIKDEKSAKAMLAFPLFSSAREKVKKRYSTADLIIKKSMEKQALMEEQNESSIDAAAEPFGRLLADLFCNGYSELSHDNKDDGILRALEWIGYNIGKWIYTLDAFDDIADDLKRNNYNPFIKSYKTKHTDKTEENKNQEELGKMIIEDARERAIFILESCLSQTAKTFELLKLRNTPILENIIYLGMKKKMDEIVGKDCKEGCSK